MIVLVILLRREISTLLNAITRIKHKDTEIDFTGSVIELTRSTDTSTETVEPERKQLAQLSPRGAVLESWLRVEKSIQSYAQRHDRQIHENMGSVDNLTYHILHTQIGRGTSEMLSNLKALRNEAVHLKDQDIDSNAAIEYEKLANRVIAKIEEI